MPKKSKQSKIEYHRDRAANWGFRYLLHATSGKTGRAKNAQRLYDFHIKELSKLIMEVKESRVQLLLIP